MISFLVNIIGAIAICVGIVLLFLAYRVLKGTKQGFDEIRDNEDATEYLETGRVFPHEDYRKVKYLGKINEDD